MALLGTIAVIIILVAFRLLVTPVPGLAVLSKRFGTRTTAVLCSIAVAGAAMAIAFSRR
jgi:hypothetical protein